MKMITLKGNLQAYPCNAFGHSWEGERLVIRENSSIVVDLRENDEFKFIPTGSTDPYSWFTTTSFGTIGHGLYENNIVGKGEAGYYRVSMDSTGRITFAREDDLMPSTDVDTRKWNVRGQLHFYHSTWLTNEQHRDLELLPEGGNVFSQKLLLFEGDELKVTDGGKAWIGYNYIHGNPGFAKGSNEFGLDPNILLKQNGAYSLRLHTGTESDCRPFELTAELLYEL